MPLAACPDQTELASWSLGRLPDERLQGIAEHLEACGECLSALDLLETPNDELLSDLGETVPSDLYLNEPTCREAVDRYAAIGFGQGDGPAPSKTWTGETVGAYEVFELIGRGGMGAVYRARHTLLKREMALKVLPSERQSDPRVVARFRREIEAVGRLSHPHIVQASDAGSADGVHFFVMELVEGPDLARLVKRLGPLPVARACAYIRQASEGLEHARRHGLVHRDVKPSNLMLTSDDCVKVLDLGLARLHDEPASNQGLTETGQIMGTADYMAPEQATGLQRVDTRADIYGLGCTLYFLLAGHPPFPGPKYKSTFDKLSAHAREPVPPIRNVRPDVSEELASVLERMLAKSPADRFATPAEVAKALAPFESGAASIPEVEPKSSAGGRGRRIARTLVACAASFFLIAGLWLASGIIIRVLDKDGREVSKTAVADGNTVVIEARGKTQVFPANDAAARPPQPSPSPSPSPAITIPPAALNVAAGEALSPLALVSHPATIPGIRSWTIETRRPRGLLFAAAFNPDGKTMACAGNDGTIRLLDAANGQLVRALIGHGDRINSLAFSPAGDVLASAGDDATIRLWNPRSGRLLRVLYFHTLAVRALAWSPDGKTLASGGMDGSAWLWDAESGQTIHTLLHPKTEGVGFVAWNPSGKQIATATFRGDGNEMDRRVRLWNAETGELVRAFEPRLGIIRGLAWSPDGKTLAVAEDRESTLSLLDAESGQLVKSFTGRNGRGLVWSPDGKAIGRGGILDVASGRTTELSVPGQSFFAWSPDGKRVVGGGDLDWGGEGAQQLRLCEAATGKSVFEVQGEQAPNDPVSWSPDGGKIASCSVEGFNVFDAMTGRLLHAVTLEGAATIGRYPTFWSPDSKTIAALSMNPFYFVDSATGQRVGTVASPEYGLSFVSAAWSPDGQTLAFHFWDETVRLWDVKSAQFFATVAGKYVSNNYCSLTFSPDSGLLAISDAREFVLWDVKAGKLRHKTEAIDGGLGQRWTLDGKGLIYAFGVGLHHWDLESLKTIRTFENSHGYGWFALSSDGKTVIASNAETVKTWDISTGKLKTSVKFPFVGMNTSPDLRRNIDTRWGALRLLDMETQRRLGAVVTPSGGRAAAFGSEGHYLGTPRIERELVYVVQTDEGQVTLAPEEFAARYGWKNDPARVRLSR